MSSGGLTVESSEIIFNILDYIKFKGHETPLSPFVLSWLENEHIGNMSHMRSEYEHKWLSEVVCKIFTIFILSKIKCLKVLQSKTFKSVL